MRARSASYRGYYMITFGLVILALFGAAFLLSRLSVGTLGTFIIIAATVIFSVLQLWMAFGTYYELRDFCLFCRFGPFSDRIPYASIQSLALSAKSDTSASRTSSLFAAKPQEIEVRRHKRTLWGSITSISPENPEDFYNQLLSRCTSLAASQSDFTEVS